MTAFTLRKTTFCCLIFFMGMVVFSGKAQETKLCDSYIEAGVNAMLNRDFIVAIENLNKAQEIVTQKKWYKQQFLIYNNVGLTYYKMQDYPEAVRYFIKAYELAMTNSQPNDEMTVLNNIAIVYTKNDNINQAEEYFRKAYQIATEQKMDYRVSLYANNLAHVNFDLKNFEKAQEYIAIALSNKNAEPRIRISTLIIKNSLLLEGKKATEVIDNCLILFEEAQQHNLLEEKTEALFLLAKAYQMEKKWEKSLETTDKALADCDDMEARKRLFELKTETLVLSDSWKEALVVKDSVIAVSRKISANQSRELFENATLKFELSESEYALETSRIKTLNQQKFYILTTLLLLLILIALGVAFYKRNLFAKQKATISENNLRIAHLELEQEVSKRQLMEKEFKEQQLLADLNLKKQKEKEENLQTEIELKNKQLSDKILFQSTRNELLENIIEMLSGKPEIAGNKTLLDIVKNLKNHLKEDTKWEDFTALFENVNNSFLQNLKYHHPDLNANDIRFLSFIYLNLNTKEIASLLNISPESCRKRRERLRKKMNLDKDASLLEYLSGLT
ncbi:MAG: tetratricopeptide repeat protein [Flavobacteriaceae bacterium]